MTIEVPTAPPDGVETRFCWAAATCVPMADGSAVLIDSSGAAHALNADGAAVWRERPTWTARELEDWLARSGYQPQQARALAETFLEELELLGLAVRVEGYGSRDDDPDSRD